MLYICITFSKTNYNMKKLILVTLLYVLGLSCAMAQNNLPDSIVKMLDELDTEIANSPKYENEKKAKINELMASLRNTGGTIDRYKINGQLYDEYKVYNSDSALHYARVNLRMSEQLKDENLVGLWKSRAAFVLINTGKMEEAKSMLRGINGAHLDNNTLIEYYEEMLHLSSYTVLYGVTSEKDYYRNLVNLYRDSIAEVCQPSHHMYLWYKANRLTESPQRKLMIADLERQLATEEDDSRAYAMNAYILSQMYNKEGDVYKEMKWLIRSSISDVRTVNREIASLSVLSKLLHARGYCKNAYRYLSYCHQQALTYNNRVRLYSITKVEQDIFDKILQDMEKHQSTQRTYNIVLVMVALAMLVLVFFIALMNRRLRRSRLKLKAATKRLLEQKEELKTQNIKVVENNTQLENLNAQLKQLNEDLSESMRQTRESDFIKEEYIGAMFHLCSTYIERMDAFRKTINRRLKTKMYDEACAMTDTPAEVQAVVKEFYASFDSIFLNIYPTFIDDFNALLKPEERIVPKEGQLMNTELRIYALVCMGITDSLRISQILHCSQQTIYNNRNRLRNKAIMDSRDFDEAVRQIGKPKGAVQPPETGSKK